MTDPPNNAETVDELLAPMPAPQAWPKCLQAALVDSDARRANLQLAADLIDSLRQRLNSARDERDAARGQLEESRIEQGRRIQRIRDLESVCRYALSIEQQIQPGDTTRGQHRPLIFALEEVLDESVVKESLTTERPHPRRGDERRWGQC